MVLGLDFGEEKKKEKEPIPVPKIATFAEEGKSDYMAPAMRQYLLEKWEKSTEEERQRKNGTRNCTCLCRVLQPHGVPLPRIQYRRTRRRRAPISDTIN